ncbi:hypothetical protein [uncultured Caulobacter sp.]|uniref:hypothetical protein n=1 Tax=uncultured Caulobacter sp. TaxID=158749 RepID=UPI00260BE232|nr:hypothetical protein [uncultured Caulobacter sp.]
MTAQALWNVFEHAAAPQKVVLILLCAALPGVLIAAVLGAGSPRNMWRRIVAELRISGPALGVFVGGLNSFHMGRTIQKLAFDPTLKQVAPGILEVSALVSLGALVGLVAVVAHGAMSVGERRERAY